MQFPDPACLAWHSIRLLLSDGSATWLADVRSCVHSHCTHGMEGKGREEKSRATHELRCCQQHLDNSTVLVMLRRAGTISCLVSIQFTGQSLEPRIVRMFRHLFRVARGKMTSTGVHPAMLHEPLTLVDSSPPASALSAMQLERLHFCPALPAVLKGRSRVPEAGFPAAPQHRLAVSGRVDPLVVPLGMGGSTPCRWAKNPSAASFPAYLWPRPASLCLRRCPQRSSGRGT